MRLFRKKAQAQPQSARGGEGMSLEDARLMALALEITSLMSNPNLPANQAYLSSGGSWLNLQVSPSDQVSVLCLALAGAIKDDPDHEVALGRILGTIRGNVIALKRAG